MAPREADLHHLGGKLAQLLVDVINGAHGHVAEWNERTREEFRAKFLDGLEEHTAALVSPLLTSVEGVSDVPAELSGLLSELGLPTEQYTGIISQFFIFGVMFNVAGAMLSPFVQQIQNDVWTAHPDRPLAPPDIATAVVRGIGFGDSSGETIPDWATALAAESGYDAQTFATMVGVTGMAPALQLLFEMVRRQIIEEGTLDGGGTTLVSGIQQSDVKDEWIETVSKLRYVQPSPIDMVRAAVQDQWDDAPVGYDFTRQKDWAQTLGLEPAGWVNDNPDWFNVLLNVYGRPPGPQEMARAANRGLTDWDSTGVASVSFHQAISESDIKNKYIPILKALAVYYPPNGEIGALLREGGITDAQADAYWVKNGVPAELLGAYHYVNTIQQVTQDRALAKGDILTLVQEQAVSDDAALEMLAEVGYSGSNAAFLIEMAHFRFELRALQRGVETVSQQYTGHAITAVEAKAGLQGLGMPPAQITQLLETLTNELNAEVKQPTPSNIASALYYGVLDQATAMSLLEGMGYPPLDAWLLLSVRMHGPLPNPPDGYVPPAPVPVAPTTAAAAATAIVASGGA